MNGTTRVRPTIEMNWAPHSAYRFFCHCAIVFAPTPRTPLPAGRSRRPAARICAGTHHTRHGGLDAPTARTRCACETSHVHDPNAVQRDRNVQRPAEERRL